MKQFIALIMYIMWTATVIALLATTFTDFKYEDLNSITVVLLIFAVINSILAVKRAKSEQTGKKA